MFPSPVNVRSKKLFPLGAGTAIPCLGCTGTWLWLSIQRPWEVSGWLLKISIILSGACLRCCLRLGFSRSRSWAKDSGTIWLSIPGDCRKGMGKAGQGRKRSQANAKFWVKSQTHSYTHIHSNFTQSNQIWKQSKCSSIGEELIKLWYSYHGLLLFNKRKNIWYIQ